jgi:hypothetical protein
LPPCQNGTAQSLLFKISLLEYHNYLTTIKANKLAFPIKI